MLNCQLLHYNWLHILKWAGLHFKCEHLVSHFLREVGGGGGRSSLCSGRYGEWVVFYHLAWLSADLLKLLPSGVIVGWNLLVFLDLGCSLGLLSLSMNQELNELLDFAEL